MKQRQIKLELSFEEPEGLEFNEQELQTIIAALVRFFQLFYEDTLTVKRKQKAKEAAN